MSISLPLLPLAPPAKPMVYIMGAGPGDVRLLTLKALEILTSQAEVIIYDRLISEEILSLIPDHVERIFAGKQAAHHYMKQDDINQLMLDKAKEGKIVVRLKGGDPFIFGRGGEEMHYLMEHNIPVEIVPGISAAEGCAATYGIPLTYRGVAYGVRFITGHQQEGKLVQLDWQGLADASTTLVIYMGLAHLAEITDKLIEHGLDKNTPAAIISNGTTAHAVLHRSTLAQIAEDAKTHEFKAPSLVVIGKVVGLDQNT